MLVTVLILLAGCVAPPTAAAVPTPLPAAATPSPSPVATPTALPSPTRTPTLLPVDTPAPTATSTPEPVDYQPLIDALLAYLNDRVYDRGFDLGIGFVDIKTGQVISIRGDDRYHAMSSFKGPLAVQYFQLVEAGVIDELPDDEKHLTAMLRVSYNQSTTCIMERVGGVPAFNDWLAAQGFSRRNNFVFSWQNWPCPPREDGFQPPADLEDIDWRYSRGDESLGLPGGGELLRCPIPQLPCDKGFAPVELAEFYARLYRGEVITIEHRDRLFEMMRRGKDETAFLIAMPEDAAVNVYTKGGTFEATEVYRVHFFNEAGIVETEVGAYALAMFMQRQPEWPGTWPMAQAARMIYDYFVAAHRAAP